MKKTRVAVLFGGMSSEHSVSLLSASSVISHISDEKYESFLIGITQKGEGYLYEGDTQKMADPSWEKYNHRRAAFVPPDS
ncbi:MAG TPA: D-alanine--D-alanine ligase A, partial [Ruminococcaceae bacterium]|nr:D-alanine--D-alanine ligase A [Oscillospiraceae bacterium]